MERYELAEALESAACEWWFSTRQERIAVAVLAGIVANPRYNDMTSRQRIALARTYGELFVLLDEEVKP